MALHVGRLSRVFKSFPLLAKKNCESGYFNALHCQPPLSVRVQLLSDVHPTSKRPYLDLRTLKDTRLELNKTSPNAVPYDISKEQRFILTADDPKLSQELEELLRLLHVTKQKGEHLPTHISLHDLQIMLEKGYSGRLQHIKNTVIRELLSKINIKRKEEALKKMERWRIERCETYNGDVPWLNYHLFGNALFQRIIKRAAHAAEHLHVAQSMQFEQNIVFDCSFDKLMRFQDARDCAKQIMMAVASNRTKRRPYNITLCNFHAKDRMPSNLTFLNPQFLDSPLTITEKTVDEVFPREKLVYLTPDSCDDLDYDPTDIYIIGAFVDKVDREPHSAGRAKRLGIRMARFPLDKYVDWHMGSKSLCINQVLDILSNVRDDGDWSKAFTLHIPSRKIKSVLQQGSLEQNRGFKKKKFLYRGH